MPYLALLLRRGDTTGITHLGANDHSTLQPGHVLVLPNLLTIYPGKIVHASRYAVRNDHRRLQARSADANHTLACFYRYFSCRWHVLGRREWHVSTSDDTVPSLVAHQ